MPTNWISEMRAATPRARHRATAQLGARPGRGRTSGSGGGIDRLLELFTQLSGGGQPGASETYAQRAAADKRAADVAHRRQLDYLRRQQTYGRAMSEWQAKRDAYEAAIQRQWEEEQTRKGLEHERQLGVSELLQERQSRYAQMLPQDSVRATLFALGLGQGTEPFRTRARHLKTTLTPLAGAEETKRGQEAALSRLLGDRKVSIGQHGVMGLGSAQQAARAYMQKGADAQRLLASAFGLGSTYEGEAPGMSEARLQELVGEVTPTGFY